MIEQSTADHRERAGLHEPPRRFASRYSRFVDLMRFVLPATAVVLTGLVVLWPYLMGGYSSLIVPSLMRGEVEVGDEMRMRQPRYVGLTEAGEPFEIVAEAATVDPDKPNRILLDELVADVARADDRDLHLTARSGVYYRAIGKLNLKGGIELTTSDGYWFATESAKVGLNQSKVSGNQPVQGEGPAGRLEADRFEIRQGGDVLRFDGQVKVTVQPRSDDASS